MKKISGFTLVEMLIAAAILGLVLTVLTNLFISSRQASERVDELSDQQQEAHATRQVLQYEIGLAGYRGVLNTGSGNSLLENRTFVLSSTSNCNTSTPNCTIAMTRRSLSTQPDALTLRYYEDRHYNGSVAPQLRTVTYSIGSDNGVSSLFRKEGSAAAIAIIPNVTNLKIADYVFYEDENVENQPSNNLNDTVDLFKVNNLAALELAITYANQQTDTILIGFSNAQKVSVTNQ